jgi:hypothetical protein
MERLFIVAIALVIYLIYRALVGSAQGSGTKATGFTGKSYLFSEILSDTKLPRVRSIRSKIRGVTKTNADGSGRQRIIRQWCHSGDALCFVREPNNPVDSNAIQVRRIVCSDVPDRPHIGEQIGYVSRELAEELAPRVDDDGFVLMAEILDVSGGHEGESVGVNFEMSVYMPVSKDTPPRKKRKPHKKARRSSDSPCIDVDDTAAPEH